MEEIVTCNICGQQFDNLDLIPKILECGHTFCSLCLNKLIRNNPSCPNCKAEIKEDKSSFPINYNTLKVVEVYKSKSWTEKEIITSIEDMKEKFKNRKDIISKKKAQMTLSLEALDECLTKLEELTVSESQRVDTVNVKKMLRELDEDYKKTDEVLSCDNVKNSVSILLSNFKDSEAYLAEIYKKVQNKENVFAVHKIIDEIKYGEISLFENKLFFHSLSLSEVPKDSSLIWFDELKQCANSKNFYTFINICCNEKSVSRVLIVRMFDKEKSHHFIKLCTGEYGPTYKGASFRKGTDNDISHNILVVTDLFENGCQARRVMDYNFCDENCEYHCQQDQVFLLIFDKIKFQIFLASKDADVINEVVGRVVFPTNLKNCINYDHSSFLKILDCGIILEV